MSEVVYPQSLHILIFHTLSFNVEKGFVTLDIFRHINSGLEQSISLLQIQPQYKTQQDNFDLVLQCWLNLLYLLLSLGLSYQVGGRVLTVRTGETFLQ